MRSPFIVLGGGPAGLSAAYELAQKGFPCIVLEQEAAVGGLSRTVQHEGYRFDLGGHRFFSKSERVNQVWREILGDDFLERPRMSRIAYGSQFFQYPLQPIEALRKLGVVAALRCTGSFLRAHVLPRRAERTLEDFFINRFGERLYEIFFKTYTEKVWGMPCKDIAAEWGAQRIQNLDLAAALTSTLRQSFGMNGQSVVKSLIGSFHYPRLGPGMMWERMADRIRELGGEILLGQRVERVIWSGDRIEAIVAGGRVHKGQGFVSTIALRDLIRALDPAPPEALQQASGCFTYRDFITVAVIIKRRDVFPDNWIYIHNESVRAGRIQNYKNWSPDMVPDPEMTCLGLEYFCFQGDGLWESSDDDLVQLAVDDLLKLKLVSGNEIVQGRVVRVPKAYPIYNTKHTHGQEAVRRFLAGVTNLQVAGRNGMHRYNNQDHAMITGMLAARNLLGESYDVWRVNADAEYIERTGRSEMDWIGREPLVPQRITSSTQGD